MTSSRPGFTCHPADHHWFGMCCWTARVLWQHTCRAHSKPRTKCSIFMSQIASWWLPWPCHVYFMWAHINWSAAVGPASCPLQPRGSTGPQSDSADRSRIAGPITRMTGLPLSQWSQRLSLLTRETRDDRPRSAQCWPCVCDAGSTLSRPWVNYWER